MAVLPPGAGFGKYRILRLIGRGGMGVVYLAEDQTLGREVALKVLDRSVTASGDFAARFRVEARTIAGLEHPFIIRIHALEQIDEELAIDMEFVSGGSVADAEKAGPIPATLALGHLRDTLLALACCHEEGIIHRDVKPSNLLIRGDGHVVLSDFGLAKLLAEYQTESIAQRTSSGLFLGTPRYAPPEAWDGQPPTPAWDVFSTGMVLYEAIAGATPYSADTPLSLMKEMIEKRIPPLSEVVEGVSPELSELAADMLARVPEDRPPDAGEVLARLSTLPELSADQADDVARTQAHGHSAYQRRLRRLRARAWWRGWGEALRRMARPAFRGVAVVAVLAVVLAGLWSAFSWSSRGVPSPAPPATDEGYRIFDTIEPVAQTLWPNHWIMTRLPDNNGWDVIAAASARLWRLQATPQATGAGLVFEGSWAEYTDTSARVFRYGTLSGNGRWLRPNEEMAATLTFTSLQDGSQSTQALILRTAANPITLAEYARRLEGSDHAQALIYKELIPRNQAWAEEVESRYLCAVSRRVTVPRRAGGVPEIDGNLDDPCWHDFIEAAGAAPGMAVTGEGDARATIRLRYDDDALYLAVAVRPIPVQPRLIITVLPRFGVPVAMSTRWAVRAEGGRVIAAQRLVADRSVPWSCDWTLADQREEDRWTAEARIPFAGIDERRSPRQGDRWRLNCQVTREEAGAEVTVATWGNADPLRAEHGLILVFQGAESAQSNP